MPARIDYYVPGAGYPQTLYNWRKKYGGMGVKQLTQYKALQEENRKLKAMYADLALDHRFLKEIVEKKI